MRFDRVNGRIQFSNAQLEVLASLGFTSVMSRVAVYNSTGTEMISVTFNGVKWVACGRGYKLESEFYNFPSLIEYLK